MIVAFIPTKRSRHMPRRTISISPATDALVKSEQREDESFSAAVSRLIEAGARKATAGRTPSYVGTFSGPTDMGINAEWYLRHPVDSR
jgi:predicted CopG family antitoxin